MKAAPGVVVSTRGLRVPSEEEEEETLERARERMPRVSPVTMVAQQQCSSC